jgi:hypothetical protein
MKRERNKWFRAGASPHTAAGRGRYGALLNVQQHQCAAARLLLMMSAAGLQSSLMQSVACTLCALVLKHHGLCRRNYGLRWGRGGVRPCAPSGLHLHWANGAWQRAFRAVDKQLCSRGACVSIAAPAQAACC